MSDRPDSPESEVVPAACPRCGASYTGNFCPRCGWPAGAPLPPQSSATRAIVGVGRLWLSALILFLVYLAAMLGALVWITPRIVEGILVGGCPDCTIFLFWFNPLNPRLLDVVGVRGADLLTWFVILLTVIFGIYAYLLLVHSKRTYRDMRLPPARVESKLGSRSPVVAVGQLFMAIIFFDLLYFSIILPFGFGIEPTAPPIDRPEWLFLYGVVNAAVSEELALRLLLIGLPMALVSLVTRLPQALAGTVASNPSRARYLAGSLKYLYGGQVRKGSPRAALVLGTGLVFASAAVFGALHVPAWGAWKFVDTFIAGLALGYLFLRHGIFASILLHLSVNSFGIFVILAGTGLVGELLLVVLLVALAIFGAGFFADYTKRTGGFLFGWVRGSRGRPAPTPRPQSLPSNPEGDPLLFPVTCPQCGGHEAQYQDGALLCSRCGTRLSTPGPGRGRGEVLD